MAWLAFALGVVIVVGAWMSLIATLVLPRGQSIFQLPSQRVIGVARLCRDHQVPCIALVGSIGPGTEHLHREGLTAHFCIADGPMIMSLLATYGVSVILVNAAILIWGGSFHGLPGVLTGSVKFLGANVALSRLVAFAVAMAVCLGVWFLLQATRFGRAVRSVSQAPELATISGISIERVRNATFALGSAMAGLAGVLLAPTFASDPQMGSRFIVKAFAVIIVGGMGSYPGAIIGALLLGVIEVFASWWTGAVIGSAVLYLIMLAMLLVRPSGLLGVRVRA